MQTLIFGLNPALQKVLEFGSLSLNRINRAVQSGSFASGKGINCIRVLQRLGGKGKLVHFTGGDSGRLISKELSDQGIETINQEISSETRICTTLISPGSITELIEPSPPVTGKEKAMLLEKLEPVLEKTGLAVFCGTYPRGVDGTFFRFLERLPSSCRIMLDGVKGVEPVLKQGVSLLKINREEMEDLTGEENFPRACKGLRERYRIDNIVVTGGRRPVEAVLGKEEVSLELPDIGKPVNVIGAGDAFLAGWIYSAGRKISGRDSLAYAAAVSLARCRVMLPWELVPEDVEGYHRILTEKD